MFNKLAAGKTSALGLLICGGVLLAPSAHAHSFGEVYTLPMPFHLYAWGAAATLILSFLFIALLARDKATQQPITALPTSYTHQLPRAVIIGLQLFSTASLVLCIATGLFGVESPYNNFNMTWFWILFVLGYTYLTALIGDLYALINPWRAISNGIAAIVPAYSGGLLRYPKVLGYWPTFLLYGGFIWLELFSKSTPLLLSWHLIGYTALNLVMIGLIGQQSWFRYGEVFSVLLRLMARMAPIGFAHEEGGEPSRNFRLRMPFSGLLNRPVIHGSLLLFILFMLAATAFDGLHESKPWKQLYWQWLYPQFLTDYFGTNFYAAYLPLQRWYQWWQRGWLMLSPFIYLAVYLTGISVMAAIVGEKIWPLAKRFAYSLLPIVLVYHVTHYYTMIESHGVKIIALASDPFGYGWDLFGTAHWFRYNIVPNVETVWHVQVGLIVFGHMVSVYIAHLEALRLFGDRRTATVSQLPMMALMVTFTVFGLWVLSQPMQLGR